MSIGVGCRGTASLPAEQKLAVIGAQTALSFASAYLKRAWRCQEDLDTCSELLQDALQGFRALPNALLFETDSSSAAWVQTLGKAAVFLNSVACG